MKILEVVVVLAGVLALCSAFGDPEVTKRSERSGSGDDNQAMVWCDHGYQLAKCECDGECDGATMQLNKDGDACVAHNKAGGNGVIAVATCKRYMLNVNSDVGNMPTANCPDDYKLVSCQIHSRDSHQYNRFWAKERGEGCFTTNGCLNCKVQARCIRRIILKDDLGRSK